MPKGRLEVFKLRLRLTPAQKKAWKIMEKQASNIYKEVNYLMYEKHKLDFVVAENLLLEGKKFEKQAPDLLQSTRDQIASDSYKYLKERGKLSTRTNKTVLISVPQDKVSFSSSENSMATPYLGLVKFESNKNFNPLSLEENQIWLRQNIRKIGFRVINQEYVCVVDCMDDEEEARRLKAENEAKTRKRAKKKAGTVNKWLE